MTSSGWTIRGCDRRENLLGRRWGNEKQWQRESETVSRMCPFLPVSSCCMFYRWIPCYRASSPNEPSPFPSTHSWDEVCSQWLCLPRSCCLFVQNYGLLVDSFEVCFL